MFTPSSTATLWPTPTDLADGIRIPDEQLVDAVYDLAFIEATERLVLDTLLLTQAEELTLVDANYAMMLAMMWLSLGVDPAVVPPPPDNRLEPAWTQVQTARNQVVLALSPVMSAADTQTPPQISEDDLIATVSTSLEVTSQALDDLGAQWHTAYGWSPSSLADLRAVAYESHSELTRPARPTAIYR